MSPNVKVFIAGVGGQGSLTLSRLLGEAALLAGQNVVVSEVHGMSQRGGVVESSVLIGDVKSPLIGARDADLLVAFEPVEALRAASYVSKKTVVIVNERKNVPFSVSMGRASYPAVSEVLERLGLIAGKVHAFDAEKLAEEAGSALSTNVVLMGAIAGTGCLPVSTDQMLETLREKTPKKFLPTNLRAFDLGRKALE